MATQDLSERIYLLRLITNPARLAELMEEIEKLAAKMLHTPYGSAVIHQTREDPEHWIIYLLDGRHPGKCLATQGTYYSVGLRTVSGSKGDEWDQKESLLNLLNYLLATPKTPDEVQKELVNSERSLRSMLERR